MKRSKFTEEQVTYVLHQAESETAVEDVCRSIGISQATCYIWKKKYGDLGASDVRRLRQLEEENLRLKRLVADLALDKSILQEVIKKDLKPSRRRSLANGFGKPMVSQLSMPVIWQSFHKQLDAIPPIRICKKVYVCGFGRLPMLALGLDTNGSTYYCSAKVGKLTLNGCIVKPPLSP